jgi:hypothetical protein
MIVSRRPKAPAELAAPAVAQNEVKSILSLPKTPAPSPAPPPAVAPQPAPPAFIAPVVQGPGAVVNLTEAADLCVDLGRLMDARSAGAARTRRVGPRRKRRHSLGAGFSRRCCVPRSRMATARR